MNCREEFLFFDKTQIMRIRILLFLMIVTLNCRADFAWTERCSKAYEFTMRLNFTKANALLAEEKTKNPENQVPLYVESQIDFLQSFISEDPKDAVGLKTRNDQRILQLVNYKSKSPFLKFFIAEMYMQKAIASIKGEEYFTAAFDVRKAYKLLEENQKSFPDFKPNLRGLGMIHAAIGTIPQSYKWTANMIGLTGTIKQGIDELKELLAATSHDHECAFLRDETILLLTFTELNLGKEKDKEMMRKRFYGIKEIHEKPLIQFAKSIFHFSVGENDSVISLLSNRTREGDAMMVSYLDFMEASARLNNLDFSSEKIFLNYVNTFKGTNYIKATWQHLAWIRLLQGDQVGYKNYITKFVTTSKSADLADEDKIAVQEAERGETPNLTLLRSRLLFDGGYYNRALLELAGKPMSLFPRQRDQLEFTYRLARIFDKLDKKDKATPFYEQTIKNGATYNYYFAANSALSHGENYEDAGDKIKATYYYRKTLSMHNHDYQNSIDQKAKAGLNRLGQ